MSRSLWMSLLPEGRRNKARDLFEERKRLGRPCPLIECLHIIDKYEIMLKDKAFLEILSIESKKQFRRNLKALEDLRNMLAHGNRFDFDERFWTVITVLSNSYDDILQAKAVRKLVEEKGIK